MLKFVHFVHVGGVIAGGNDDEQGEDKGHCPHANDDSREYEGLGKGVAALSGGCAVRCGRSLVNAGRKQEEINSIADDDQADGGAKDVPS